MPGTCVIGLQWGDEAKGKLVDILTEDHPIVVRYQGGGQVFIHSAVVVGDDVLRVGSLAMAKVIKDRSRADEGLKATEAYGPAQGAERARLRRATVAAACARKAAEVNLRMARQAEELVDRPPGLKAFFAKKVEADEG